MYKGMITTSNSTLIIRYLPLYKVYIFTNFYHIRYALAPNPFSEDAMHIQCRWRLLCLSHGAKKWDHPTFEVTECRMILFSLPFPLCFDSAL